jgi:hypothetical protein
MMTVFLWDDVFGMVVMQGIGASRLRVGSRGYCHTLGTSRLEVHTVDLRVLVAQPLVRCELGLGCCGYVV